ncbi:putative enoyl-[acyl-carrier-protein] reductase (NADH) [Helianthus anomalus]
MTFSSCFVESKRQTINAEDVFKALEDIEFPEFIAPLRAYRFGPLRSRAAKAIGFIDMMIDYSLENAPLQKELSAEEVGNVAAFQVKLF